MKTVSKFNVAIVVAAVLVAVCMTGLFWSFRRVEDAAEVRKQNRVLVADANALLLDLVNAETGQRGYFLTGDEAFLTPYLSVRDSIKGRVSALLLHSTNRASQQDVKVLAPLVDAKLQELSNLVVLRRTQDIADAQSLVRNNESKRLMDSIRVTIRDFVDLETTSLGQREAKFVADLSNLFVGITAASVLALLFALAFAYLIRQRAGQGSRNLVHAETSHLLIAQEALVASELPILLDALARQPAWSDMPVSFCIWWPYSCAMT